MIKKILLQLLVRWYTKRNRKVFGMSVERELKVYLMKDSADIEDCLKAEISARTLSYFEAKSDRERDIIRGEIMALKMFKDRHLLAVKLNNDDKYKNNETLKKKYWKNFKI